MLPGDIQTALAKHAFEHLFIECLGWDRLRAHVALEHNGSPIELTSVAQKRGFAVFACPTHRTVLANRRALRHMQRELRKSYHEHILIHYCETPRKQVWQWATLVDGQRRIQHREHPFFSDQPPPRLLERIRGLAVTMAEEEQLTLPDILARVRDALRPDSELQLFAKYPEYAAQSDRLAMAVKRGEPGALQQFVEFHMRLARHNSKVLIRWFDMEPDDAEQTAMIGLIEAARRFDPDRGYLFSTYAGYWIRNACQRYGLKWGLPIHVPTYYFWTCYKLAFIESQLIATHGRQDASEHFERELAEAGVTPEQWRHFCVARQLLRFSEIDKRELAKADRPEEPLPVAEDAIRMRDDIDRALKSLHARDAEVLRMRYGFDQEEHTLQEVAVKLGLTRERIRQIQFHAEKKLVRILRRTNKNGDYGEEADEPEVELVEGCQ